MAKKPNYGFEKRQKELAKKSKKEEKKRRKLEDKEGTPAGNEMEEVAAEENEA